MSEIIISYRERDTQAQAERLRDVLHRRLGATTVQLGVTAAVPAGENPRAAIAAAIPHCKALIVLVGPQWRPEEWLGDPADYDRRAIAVALREKRLIIPVLVDGATLPAGDHPILAALARRGGVPLDAATFAHDATEIAEIALCAPGARRTGLPQPAARSPRVSARAVGIVASTMPALPLDAATIQKTRKFTPALFGLILFLFLLPFVTISCGTTGSQQVDIATISGFELVTGKTIALGGVGTSSASRMNPEFSAILALLAVLVGLGVSFRHNKIMTAAAAGAGVASFLFLLLTKFSLDNQAAHPSSASTSSPSLGSVAVQVHYQLGFWLALFVSLVAAAVNIYFYTQEPKPDLLAAPTPPPYQPTYQPVDQPALSADLHADQPTAPMTRVDGQ